MFWFDQFVCTAMMALSMAVGYKTRASAFATWVMVVSIHVRNLNVLNGGDHMSRMLLLFAFLCPGLGDAWSVDALLENGRRMTAKQGDVKTVVATASNVVFVQPTHVNVGATIITAPATYGMLMQLMARCSGLNRILHSRSAIDLYTCLHSIQQWVAEFMAGARGWH
jgi:hypothetical protein